MNKLGKVAVALAMAFSVGAALTASAKEYSLKEGDDLEATLVTAKQEYDEMEVKEPAVLSLGEGTYPIAGELCLDWPVTVQGATGVPGDVIVDVQNKNKAFCLNNSKAVLRSLTVYRGYCNGVNSFGVVRICQPNGSGNQTNSDKGSSSGLVSNVVFNACSCNAKLAAGVLYLNGGTASHCVITNCTGSHQQDSSGSHGMFLWVKGGVARDCLVARNSTSVSSSGSPTTAYFGSVAVSGGSLVNCTVADNKVTGAGAVIGCAGVRQTGGKVVNTLIANNKSGSTHAHFDQWSGTASTFVNCLTDGEEPINETCVCTMDACFVDGNKCDYRLCAESKAIGAGSTDAVTYFGDLDLAGQPRFHDGLIDIGAYALSESGETIVHFSATPSGVGREPMGVTFIGRSLGLGAAETLEYQWDYDSDGVVDEVTPTNAVLKEFAYGEYSVTLTVVNTQTGASQGETKENLLNVKFGSHVHDVFETDGEYALEDKIAWIGEQFGAKEVPQTIRLHPGTYKLSQELYINWPLTICGSTGNPDDVTVEGDKTFRLLTINHADAEVKDITLAKGYFGFAEIYDWGNAGVRICAPGSSDRTNKSWHTCAYGAGGKLTHCVVCDCSTTYYHCWGIVYLNGPKGKTIVDRCVIRNNSHSGQENGQKGKGDIVTVQSGIFRNSLVKDNTTTLSYVKEPASSYQGIVTVCGADGEIVGCTVANNWQKGENKHQVAGILATAGKVVNTIIAGNRIDKPTDAQDRVWHGTASCFIDCWTDTAEPINETCEAGEDPQFLAAELGDYHILKTSPCRNAGTNDTLFAIGDLDLYGLPRTNVVDGAVTLDLGACQYDPNAVVAAASCEIPSIRYDSVDAVFNVLAAGFGDAPRYYWDFDGDGVTDYVTDAASFTHRLGIGAYAASVVTSNLEDNVGLKTVVEGGAFEVLPRPVHFVDINGKKPVAPYWTVETAATNIQDAIDVALQGEEVRILPGTYKVKRSLVVTNNYTIVGGATGNPEDVIVRAVTESNRCMQVNAGSRALVHSLVLENGRCGDGSVKLTNNGHGPCLSIADTYISVSGGNRLEMLGSNHKGGIVSNCVIRGGSFDGSKFQRSGGVFLCGANALLTHCVVSNNTNTGGFSDNGWFGAAGVFLHNGARAENCLIIKNKSGSGNYYQAAVVVGDKACLRYSTVTGNNCALVGGVNVFGTGRFEKCVIADNTLSKSDTTDPRHKVWGAFNSGMDNYNRSNLKTDLANEEVRHLDEAVQARVTTNASNVAEADLGPGSLTVETRLLFAHPKRGDFHPRPSSPTVDAVPPEAETAAMPQADLKGNRRLFGDGYDLGAVEGNYKGLLLLVR